MTSKAYILAIILIGMFAVPSWADTRVRAGEHATFTRIVLYFPSQVDQWTATRAEDGYLIDIDPAPRGLDTTDVFAFIPRTRVRDLTLRDGTVWIDSDCDCHISLFRARADVIAIDIRDGPDPSQTAIPTGSAATEGPEISPFLLTLRNRDNGELWQVPPRVAFVPPPEPATVPQVINSTELANAVARAASGGLLRPSDADIVLGGPGLETRSALDSAKLDHEARMRSELCSNLELLENLEAVSPTDAWQLIENTTSAVTTIQRAMAYLSLGFGAEAAVDFADGELSPDKTILLAQVAHFVDTPDRPAPRSMRAARSCGGVPALLAVMATPLSEDLAETHAIEAVTSLSRLPYALRAHLAPFLERRLIVAGFSELAQSASFTSHRVTGDTGTNNRAAAAKMSPDNTGFSELRANLPQTAFFDARTSEPIYAAIGAARFAAEDRILIEAWIKEAPSPTEADTATAFYVESLNKAGRPLDALAHLDMRFGRRGIVSPGLEAAIGDTLDTAADVLGPGELLVLGARISERPWFDRLPAPMRLRFAANVDAVRLGITGETGMPAPPTVPQDQDSIAGIDVNPPSEPSTRSGAGNLVVASPRRIAAETAILAATESLTRSARLRAEATENTAEWQRQ